jgi:large subunit ribosomal protein L3
MNTSPGIYGKKLGMTQVFTEDGTVERVTVVEAGPVVVIGKRTQEKDGYVALIVGFQERKEKHTSKASLGMFKKANQTPKRVLKEIRGGAEFCAKFEVGQTLKLDEIFKVGQHVDARGTSRGRGFSGVVRKYAFAGAVQTHGTHEYRRHGGSIGTNMTPGRTLPNLRMPGQYGNATVSMLNLRLVRIDNEKNLLLIEGGIPGPRNGIVLIRHAVKKAAKAAAAAKKKA